MSNTLRRWGLLFIVIVIFLVFWFFLKPFRSVENIMNILRATSIMAIFTLALTIVLNAGDFDLSFTYVGTFAAVVGAVALTAGFNILLIWFVAIIIGVILGLVNGFVVTKIRIPSFIATLGMSSLLNGISNSITRGASYYRGGWPESLKILGRSRIANIIPVPVVILGIVGLLTVFFIEYTSHGRQILAVGSNASAASHVGIKVSRIKMVAFAVAGGLSALAGIITWSLLGMVSAEMDMGFQMQAISAAFLGAVFLRDGIPNVAGSLVAALLLAVVSNGMTMFGVSFYVRYIVEGLILLCSVGILAFLKRGALKSVTIGI